MKVQAIRVETMTSRLVMMMPAIWIMIVTVSTLREEKRAIANSIGRFVVDEVLHPRIVVENDLGRLPSTILQGDGPKHDLRNPLDPGRCIAWKTDLGSHEVDDVPLVRPTDELGIMIMMRRSIMTDYI